MVAFLQNPWVIGIGGGVISGFVVFFITQLIFNNSRAATNRRNVDMTNREVIYALRPGIPEGEIPSKDIVDALIHATGRKYGVDSKDAYDCVTIGEELIKEVVDSSFISAKQKAEYVNSLRTLMIEPALAESSEATVRVAADTQRLSRTMFSSYATYMAGLLGAITATMTVVFVFISERTRTGPNPDIQALLLPAGVTLVLTMVISPLLMLWRQSGISAVRVRLQQPRVETDSSDGPAL